MLVRLAGERDLFRDFDEAAREGDLNLEDSERVSDLKVGPGRVGEFIGYECGLDDELAVGPPRDGGAREGGSSA